MKRAIKASNFVETPELHINGDWACDLIVDETGYYQIDPSDAKGLYLSEGDTLTVELVDHEMD